MYGIIYVVKNKVNGKTYVGQTIQKWPKRKHKHLYDPMDYSAIDRAIKKYGKENFEWDIIDEADDQKTLDMLERLHISRYESMTSEWGYNIKEGGSNGKPSLNSRKKMSENSARYWLGKKHSEESKKKMSEAHKGKILSEEHKNNISKNHWYKNGGTSHMKGKFGKKSPNFGKQFGKYRGAQYVKGGNPWTKVWKTVVTYKGNRKYLGHFNDPISAQIVYDFVFNEIYGEI